MYLPVGLKKHDICGKRYVIALKTCVSDCKYFPSKKLRVLVEDAALTQE